MERPRAPPIAPERSDRVAVGTHELALRDLAEDLLLRSADPRSADIANLLEPGQMIPLHHLAIEHAPAISAGSSSLQAAQPGATRHYVDLSRLSGNASADLPLVSRMTDLGGAFPAIDL